jgi:hypothetical protein
VKEKQENTNIIVKDESQPCGVPVYVPIQTEKEKTKVCDVCGHVNSEKAALCEMCSNYLFD